MLAVAHLLSRLLHLLLEELHVVHDPQSPRLRLLKRLFQRELVVQLSHDLLLLVLVVYSVIYIIRYYGNHKLYFHNFYFSQHNNTQLQIIDFLDDLLLETIELRLVFEFDIVFLEVDVRVQGDQHLFVLRVGHDLLLHLHALFLVFFRLLEHVHVNVSHLVHVEALS